MNIKRKIAGVGTIVGLFVTLTALQLQAQTPTATPENPTATTVAVTSTPKLTTTTSPTITTLSTRQAVVKRPIDGDSVEVVFTDNGEIAMVHLANVDAPEFAKNTECFGRESSGYVMQIYRDSPLISISLVGEIQDGEVFGYVELPDGTLLNRLVVLFGYARFDDQFESVFTSDIENAEEQSRRGKTGLWRVCGETEQPPQPCFLFANREIDKASMRALFVAFPDADEFGAHLGNVMYDPVQNELIVNWSISIDDLLSGWRMKEFYRLSDCLRDRSEVYNQRDRH